MYFLMPYNRTIREYTVALLQYPICLKGRMDILLTFQFSQGISIRTVQIIVSILWNQLQGYQEKQSVTSPLAVVFAFPSSQL